MSDKNSGGSSSPPAKPPSPPPAPASSPEPKTFVRPTYVTIEKGWRPQPDQIDINGPRKR